MLKEGHSGRGNICDGDLGLWKDSSAENGDTVVLSDNGRTLKVSTASERLRPFAADNVEMQPIVSKQRPDDPGRVIACCKVQTPRVG